MIFYPPRDLKQDPNYDNNGVIVYFQFIIGTI